LKKAYSSYSQPLGKYQVNETYSKETNLEANLSYNKRINDDWSINAFIAGNRMYAYDEGVSNVAKSLVIPGLYTVSNGVAGDVDYRSWLSKKEIRSAYGMASVGFKDMIYVDLTARNDWSSTLPVNNRSYFYPSASLSMILSEMFSMPQWLTHLKLRGGYAQVGNDTYAYNLNQVFTIGADWGSQKRIYMGGNLKNPNLKPEKATSKEIGADIRFLNNRIGLEATYYTADNENQVLGISLPIESGASSKSINAGLIQSRGVEIALNVTPVIVKDFQWDMNISFTHNRTKLVRLTEGLVNFDFGSFEGAIFRCYEGDYIGDIYQQPLLRVSDENSPYYGYPLLNAQGFYQVDNDPAHIEKIGNSNPDFSMGFQPSFRYKSFSLYANIDWSQGGKYYSGTRMFFNNNGWSENSFSGMSYDRNRDIESQIKENPQAWFGEWVGGRNAELGGFPWPDEKGRDFQDASFNVGVREVIVNGVKTYVENLGGPSTIFNDPFQTNRYTNRSFPSRNIYSATYVKLREIALTYHCPKQFNERLHLQHCTVSLVANNLFKWAAAGPDMDPEGAYKVHDSGTRWLAGMEYYNVMPFTGSIGVKLSVDF
jgi:hypothetical protein